MIIFGHRGAKGYEPENTLLSITKAISLGVKWIEVDVYLVEDQLMVFHDETLERTTNGNGFILESSVSYLRSLDAGKGEKIPFLTEVIDLAYSNKIGINIELKGPHTAKPVAEFLKDRLKSGFPQEKILVSSFRHNLLLEFKNILPQVQTGALLVGIPTGLAKFAEELGCYSLNISCECIDANILDDAERRRLKVFCFTVNDVRVYRKLEALGVDGVFSDYPDIFS